MTLHEVMNLIGSIHNRCEIIEFLNQKLENMVEHWMATLIEDIYEDAQELIEFCKAGNSE